MMARIQLSGPHMKILLPVDGSECTKRMLAYLAANNKLLGTGHEYIFLTATTPVPPHLNQFLDPSVIEAYHRDEADRVLNSIRIFAQQQGWDIRTHQEAGSAAHVIVDLAEKENVNLIVMGTHGHSALSHLIMGSVTSAVLAKTRIPVLLIH